MRWSSNTKYDAFGQPYLYDAIGAAMTVNGHPGSPLANRFLFTDREWSELGSRDIDGQAERPRERERTSQWLSDLGVYDYRNRLYHPELGRFLQPDPKEFAAGDYNLYRYCHNDPVNRSDPFGLLDYRFEKGFPEDGPGGRKAVVRAIEKELRKSEKGREILAAKGVVTVHVVNATYPTTQTAYDLNPKNKDFDTYVDPRDSRLQDAKTFRALSKHPGELPPDNDKGRAVIIGHEFSHGVFKEADEHNGGRNIRDNENAIRRELGLPLRRSDGGDQFRVDD